MYRDKIHIHHELTKTQYLPDASDNISLSDLHSTSAAILHHPRPEEILSLLDLPAEVRNQIYEAVFAASWTTTRKRRIVSQSSRARQVSSRPNLLAEALAFRPKAWVPKKDELWKRQAVRPPAFALAFTCKQIYREFVPLFYFKAVMVIGPEVVHDPEWCAAIIVPRRSDGDPHSQHTFGVPPPLHLVKELCINVHHSWTQEQARSWLVALSGIAKITRGHLERLSIAFDPEPVWMGSGNRRPLRTPELVPPETDSDSLMNETLDANLRVDPAGTKAFAEVLTRFRGLDRLVIRHVDIGSWAPVLDSALDRSLRLYSAVRERGFRRKVCGNHRVIYLTTDATRLSAMATKEELNHAADGSIQWYYVRTLEAHMQSVRSQR